VCFLDGHFHEFARGRSNNYGDIVWWDMLFGTYDNPKEFTTSCGFDDEKEQRLASIGFDVEV
jgi:sterol desaturase/sphingolipid hydroxylase (fatty acid hydroxylase superfamily)